MTIKTSVSVLFMSAGLLISLAGGASASPTAAQQQAIRSACPNDFRSYCSGVSPGGAAALQCLEKNVAKLSSACQSAVKAVMPAPSSSSTSSSNNAATSTDSSGTANSSATTDSSDDATSDSDAAATQQTQPQTQKKTTSQPATAEPTVRLTLRQEIFLVREACGPEFRAYCSGIQLGGGNAVNCLRAHANKLTGACKGAISDLMH
ncbi:MAG: cysteine rich repeat-containing protein [Hyphomicrobiales bacterium]